MRHWYHVHVDGTVSRLEEPTVHERLPALQALCGRVPDDRTVVEVHGARGPRCPNGGVLVWMDEEGGAKLKSLPVNHLASYIAGFMILGHVIITGEHGEDGCIEPVPAGREKWINRLVCDTPYMRKGHHYWRALAEKIEREDAVHGEAQE